MKTSKERMELLLSHLQLNGNELAASLGYKRSDRVYHVLRERNGISESLARDICELYHDVNYQWLLTGEGSMLIEDSIVPESTTVDQDDDEKAELIKIIEELRKENSRLVETNERLSRVVDRLLDEKESGRAAI